MQTYEPIYAGSFTPSKGHGFAQPNGLLLIWEVDFRHFENLHDIGAAFDSSEDLLLIFWSNVSNPRRRDGRSDFLTRISKSRPDGQTCTLQVNGQEGVGAMLTLSASQSLQV